MDPASVGVDLVLQGVGVSRLQLLDLPPVEHARGQVVALVGQRLQHLRVGRIGARLALALALQAHLVEQDLAQLLGRADGEALAGQLVDPLLQLRHTLAEVAAHLLQHRRIDLDPGALHIGQHLGERALQRLVDAHHLLRQQPRLQQRVQAEGDVRVLRRVVERLVERDLVEGYLLLAGTGDVLIGDRRVAQVVPGQFVHAVAVLPAFQHVGQQHGVVDRRDLEPVARQHHPVVLDVLPDLERARVFQERLQRLKRRVEIDLVRRAVAGEVELARALARVRERDVAGPPGRGGERDADQFRAQRVERGGLRVERDQALVERLRDPGVQTVLGLHQLVVRLRLVRGGLVRLFALQVQAREQRGEGLLLQPALEHLGVGLPGAQVR